MDDHRIDGHKLMFHISRVNQWLEGELIHPIYIEIGPSGSCNHRCIFCALDYLNYKPKFIDKDILKKFLAEAVDHGIKSVMYAGEGEPLLHKDIAELIVYTKRVGLDAALTTNAVLFDQKFARKVLGSLSWVRISLNAGTAKTYANIHRCPENNFNKVLKNLSVMLKVKKDNKFKCSIGAQLVLLPENYQEVSRLANLLKDKGLDYLIIKPFSRHPMSSHRLDKNFDCNDYLYLGEELKSFSNKDFKIIFRSHAMKKLKEKKPYKHCLGLPFFAYLASNGDLYACSAFLGNKRFCYGNIYKESFSRIWEGKRKKNILARIENKLNISRCRKACRLDEINRYLWELKHPRSHVNFI